MARTPKRRPLNVRRAAEFAFDFFKANQATLLGPQVAMAILNRGHDHAASAMFKRLAHDPNLQLIGTPTGVLALMSWRIAKLIMSARDRPEAFPDFGILFNDANARTFVFEHILGVMSLPSERHGQLLVDTPSGPIH